QHAANPTREQHRLFPEPRSAVGRSTDPPGHRQKSGDAWAQNASTYIGNGPFMMSDWVHQDHITLVPNPNYNGQKPMLSKVTLLMVSNLESDYAAYRNNERDWTLVPDADVQAVRNDPQLSKEA